MIRDACAGCKKDWTPPGVKTEKPEGTRSGVAKGLPSIGYGGNLGALALKPSGFCWVGVNSGLH